MTETKGNTTHTRWGDEIKGSWTERPEFVLADDVVILIDPSYSGRFGAHDIKWAEVKSFRLLADHVRYFGDPKEPDTTQYDWGSVIEARGDDMPDFVLNEDVVLVIAASGQSASIQASDIYWTNTRWFRLLTNHAYYRLQDALPTHRIIDPEKEARHADAQAKRKPMDALPPVTEGVRVVIETDKFRVAYMTDRPEFFKISMRVVGSAFTELEREE